MVVKAPPKTFRSPDCIATEATIPFGPARVTRLISGGSPLVANSHFSPELSEEMRAYFTAEEVVRYLHRCVAAGIDTVQVAQDGARILDCDVHCSPDGIIGGTRSCLYSQ